MRSKIILGLFVVIVIVALIGGWFYWFEYRPFHIKSICDMEAREKVFYIMEFESGPDREFSEVMKEYAKEISPLKDNYEKFYEACLHKEGLK